jgi:hypothetical protein
VCIHTNKELRGHLFILYKQRKTGRIRIIPYLAQRSAIAREGNVETRGLLKSRYLHEQQAHDEGTALAVAHLPVHQRIRLHTQTSININKPILIGETSRTQIKFRDSPFTMLFSPGLGFISVWETGPYSSHTHLTQSIKCIYKAVFTISRCHKALIQKLSQKPQTASNADVTASNCSSNCTSH